MRRIFTFPFFPLFVCIGVVLALEASSRYTPVAFPYATLGIVFGLTVAGFLGLLFITKRLFTNWREASFLASAGVFILYCLIQEEMGLVVTLLLVGLVVIGLGKNINWKVSTVFLNLISGFVCAVIVIAGVTSNNIFRPVTRTLDSLSEIPVSTLPDVYLLVLDEYPSSEELERQFGFNNSLFISELEARSCTVFDNYYTSYPKTELSIDTIMSMDYLTEFTNVNALFKDRAVLTEFDELGYTSVLLGSGWYPTSFGFEFDYTLQGFFPEIYALEALHYYDDENYQYSQPFWRDVVTFQYDQLRGMTTVNCATFTFAHILGAHTPFSFDANGSMPSYSESRATLFLGQVEYTNSQILDFLDSVDKEAIVVIVSDHGPYTEAVLGYPESCSLDFGGGNYSDYIRSRLSGILIVRGPELNLSDAPVQPNIFREIFNTYFGENYSSLAPRYFFSTNWCESNFSDIFEVTTILEAN